MEKTIDSPWFTCVKVRYGHLLWVRSLVLNSPFGTVLLYSILCYIWCYNSALIYVYCVQRQRVQISLILIKHDFIFKSLNNSWCINVPMGVISQKVFVFEFCLQSWNFMNISIEENVHVIDVLEYINSLTVCCVSNTECECWVLVGLCKHNMWPLCVCVYNKGRMVLLL